MSSKLLRRIAILVATVIVVFGGVFAILSYMNSVVLDGLNNSSVQKPTDAKENISW